MVDATNLLMLELGQPVHAYDADGSRAGKFRCAWPDAGEKLPLLDGTEVTWTGSELVIADGEAAVGLAGVMGGGNSEVQDTTTRVFLECAEFHPSFVFAKLLDAIRRKRTPLIASSGASIPQGLPHAISRLAALDHRACRR